MQGSKPMLLSSWPACHAPQERCMKSKVPGLPQQWPGFTQILQSNSALLYELSFARSAFCVGLCRLCWHATGASPGYHSISPSKEHLTGDSCYEKRWKHLFPWAVSSYPNSSCIFRASLSALPSCLKRDLWTRLCNTWPVKKFPHKWTLLEAQSLSAGQLWTAERKTDIVQEGESVFGLLSYYNLCFLALISLEVYMALSIAWTAALNRSSHTHSACGILHCCVRQIPVCWKKGSNSKSTPLFLGCWLQNTRVHRLNMTETKLSPKWQIIRTQKVTYILSNCRLMHSDYHTWFSLSSLWLGNIPGCPTWFGSWGSSVGLSFFQG